MVPSVADIFLTLPETSTIAHRFCGHQGQNTGCGHRVVRGYDRRYTPSVHWLPIAPARPVRGNYGKTGGFSYGIIVACQGCKWSKLCRPVVHGHPLTSRGNMVWQVYDVIVTGTILVNFPKGFLWYGISICFGMHNLTICIYHQLVMTYFLSLFGKDFWSKKLRSVFREWGKIENSLSFSCVFL